MASIAFNIKDLRIRGGYSQEELAAAIGKTRSAVSQYEAGKIIPRMGVIEDMARFFGVSKDWIISGRVSDEPVYADERELLALYRRMEPSQKLAIMEVARSMAVASEKDGAGNREHEKVAR